MDSTKPVSVTLQGRVGQWVLDAFGPANALNRRERALRVLEEAAELCQAEGVGLEQVVRVSERTFSRPVGDPAQEAAGIGVTLLAWGAAAGVDVLGVSEQEIARVEQPEVMEAIRARQVVKKADGVSAT